LLAACPISAAAQPSAEEEIAREQALTLLEDSAAAYREGRFADAAAMLQQAYALHPEPILLYNLARALEADGQLDEARDAYRSFLEASPEAAQAAPSRRRLEVIEGLIAEREAREAADAARLAEEEAAPHDDASAPTPTTPPEVGPDTTAPWIVVSASVAVLATGAILLAVANSRYNDAVNEEVHLTAASLQREAFALRDAGAVLLGVGAAATVGSAIWLIVASLEAPSSSDAVAVQVSPFGLSVSGSF
jgi:tetratricopeptide (TPR) repeat protein